MCTYILERINQAVIVLVIITILNIGNYLANIKKNIGLDNYKKLRRLLFAINRNTIISFLSIGLGILCMVCLHKYTNRSMLTSTSLIFEHPNSYLALLIMSVFLITQGASQFVINIVKVLCGKFPNSFDNNPKNSKEEK